MTGPSYTSCSLASLRAFCMIVIALLICPRADREERAIFSVRLLLLVNCILAADHSTRIGGEKLTPEAAFIFLLMSSSA